MTSLSTKTALGSFVPFRTEKVRRQWAADHEPDAFLRNCWYVAAWSDEVQTPGTILGRVIIAEPVVIWRDAEGALHAFEDRCAHRQAQLSLGRVEGQTLRCMYHGMCFDAQGVCVSVPGMENPPKASIRTYPVVEMDNWIWIWMGNADRAETTLIPRAFGIEDPHRPMRHDAIVYNAHYQLIHDNLCDLTHIDFTHETSLCPLTGTRWSPTMPRVTVNGRGLLIERWFESALLPGTTDVRVDTWISYRFDVPGLFIMNSGRYELGTAKANNYSSPLVGKALLLTGEQQAVTPIDGEHTMYFFATGRVEDIEGVAMDLDSRIDLVRTAFDEDRRMIEAQQAILNRTAPDHPMLFLPQDKAPLMMRRLMRTLIKQEQEEAGNTQALAMG